MSENHRHEEREEFGELIKFTLAGFGASLILGWFLDSLGIRKNPVGEWGARTLAGEGESILEGVFAIRKRLSGATRSLAQAYS